MREWLKKKEYELYVYIKKHEKLDITGADLAKILKADKSDISKRLKSLEQKGYIIRNGTYIKVT